MIIPQKLIWKRNFYSKQEKKSNILLNIAKNNDILLITDNLAKYFAINLKMVSYCGAKLI